RGGNPIPKIQWLRGGRHITQDISTTVSDSLVQSELRLVVSPEDNSFGTFGAPTYECRAISSTIKQPLRAQHNFTVHFPPKTVKIRKVTPVFKAGGVGTLECVTDASNPAAPGKIGTLFYFKIGILFIIFLKFCLKI